MRASEIERKKADERRLAGFASSSEIRLVLGARTELAGAAQGALVAGAA